MKILHINFSKSGGAGVFARDLVEAQVESGIDARLINLRDSDLRREPLRDPLLTLQASLDQYIVKNSKFESPISVFRGGTRLKSQVMEFRPDLIHLHWTEGVVSDTWISKLSTPVVWTLHDFRPITGACHQHLGCSQFEKGCNSCPAVKLPFKNHVSKSFSRREGLGLFKKISFVAPSKWVANAAQNSAALQGRAIPVVYNATPPIQIEPRAQSWAQDQLDEKRRPLVVIAFGSNSSRLKGKKILDALGPGVFDGFQVVSFGADGLTWADRNLGLISREQVSAIYSRAKLVIIPSQAETFSLAAFEATRVGTPVCGLSGGAVQEIAEEFGEFIPLDANYIRGFLNTEKVRSSRVIPRTMSDVVNGYKDVYENAISTFNSK